MIILHSLSLCLCLGITTYEYVRAHRVAQERQMQLNPENRKVAPMGGEPGEASKHEKNNASANISSISSGTSQLQWDHLEAQYGGGSSSRTSKSCCSTSSSVACCCFCSTSSSSSVVIMQPDKNQGNCSHYPFCICGKKKSSNIHPLHMTSPDSEGQKVTLTNSKYLTDHNNTSTGVAQNNSGANDNKILLQNRKENGDSGQSRVSSKQTEVTLRMMAEDKHDVYESIDPSKDK